MRILTLMLAALALALPSLAAAQTYTPVQTEFREFYRAKSMGKKYPPDTVQPQPYAVELYNRGIRPDLTSPDTAIPDWVIAEGAGRNAMAKYRATGGLTGQQGGKWRQDYIGVTDNFTFRMIWARGPLPLQEAAPLIVYGAWSWPDDALRIVQSLPGGAVVDPVRSVTVTFESGKTVTR